MSGFSQLLRRAQDGERAALSDLYARFRGSVERDARHGLGPTLKPHFDPADIAQSVFGDLLREISGLEDRGEAAFRGWLRVKVQNKLRMKARRQVMADGRRREARLTTTMSVHVAASAASPDAAAAEQDDAAHLNRVLGTLEPEQRAVIGLRIDEALPWIEVARRLGLPTPDAARVRYVRVLATLRDRWTPD